MALFSREATTIPDSLHAHGIRVNGDYGAIRIPFNYDTRSVLQAEVPLGTCLLLPMYSADRERYSKFI